MVRVVSYYDFFRYDFFRNHGKVRTFLYDTKWIVVFPSNLYMPLALLSKGSIHACCTRELNRMRTIEDKTYLFISFPVSGYDKKNSRTNSNTYNMTNPRVCKFICFPLWWTKLLISHIDFKFCSELVLKNLLCAQSVSTLVKPCTHLMRHGEHRECIVLWIQGQRGRGPQTEERWPCNKAKLIMVFANRFISTSCNLNGRKVMT